MTDYSSQSSKKKTADGSKAYQRTDKEDRSLIYRNWRREVGKTEKNGRLRKTCYTSDIDQVEYIFVKNEPIPIAILELTRYDMDEYDMPSHSWAKYKQSILDRYFFRDAQGKFIQAMAARLDCEAWIVLFRHDLEAFWMFNLTDHKATWIRKDAQEYKEWLADLKEQGIKDNCHIGNIANNGND